MIPQSDIEIVARWSRLDASFRADLIREWIPRRIRARHRNPTAARIRVAQRRQTTPGHPWLPAEERHTDD